MISWLAFSNVVEYFPRDHVDQIGHRTFDEQEENIGQCEGNDHVDQEVLKLNRENGN